MKTIILCFVFLLAISSSCSVAQGESLTTVVIAPIAIELRANNNFMGYVGKLEFDYGETINVITFGSGVLGNVQALAEVYKILEKEMRPFGIYHIKAENQYGVILSGMLDASDKLNPKITLIKEGGIVLTNISVEGREMKKKYIPRVFLGSGE